MASSQIEATEAAWRVRTVKYEYSAGQARVSLGAHSLPG